MWKQFLNDYLSFTKKDRRGIIIVIIVIGVSFLFPFIYPYFLKEKKYDHSQFERIMSRLKVQHADSAGNKNFDPDNYSNYYEPSERNYYSRPKAELFYFDPNTASINDWKRLGIREKTAETIQKYLSKGGHFYKPEDISKIWGLHKDDVERLLPYVRIESKRKEYADAATFQNKPAAGYREIKPTLRSIDINTSDTSAFISLPGIGSKLAQRIVLFRDKLGGFYSVGQIKETYGLPDSTFQKIQPKLVITGHVKKININNATLDEMKSHPYLRYNLANAIIQYRTQHGKFSSVADIKKIMIVTEEIFNKISPYLTIN